MTISFIVTFQIMLYLKNPTGSEKTSKVFAQITICHLVLFAARFNVATRFGLFHRLGHRGGDKTTIYEGGGKAGGKSSTGKGKAGEGKGSPVGKMGKVKLEANLWENDLGSLWHRLAPTTAFAKVTKSQILWGRRKAHFLKKHFCRGLSFSWKYCIFA